MNGPDESSRYPKAEGDQNHSTHHSWQKTSMAEPHSNPKNDSPDVEEKDVKSPNIIERMKEEIEAVTHSPKHHKETHGRSDDINENTPAEEVKGPSVFERVKEEFEAIAEAIHPRKKSDSHESSS